jgi:hypothetical protein
MTANGAWEGDPEMKIEDGWDNAAQDRLKAEQGHRVRTYPGRTRTFDDITESDLEYQQGRLAKVRGRRPSELDGWELQNLSMNLARLLHARIPKPDTRTQEQKDYEEWQYRSLW